MERIELEVDAPMASPRPRFRNAGKFVQTYMPAKYTKHKKMLRQQMPDRKSTRLNSSHD